MTKSLAKVHPELFHYTNAKGLIGIIESQSMWATHYAYLNDSEEIRHFLKSRLPDLLRTVVNEYLDKFTQDESIQLRIDQQGDRKKIVDSFIQKIRNVNKKFLLEDTLAEPYIASFYTTSGLEEKGVRKQVAQHGLLSQWRGYGNDGGYAIVFDTEQFVELLKDVGKKMESSMYPFLADVVYSSDPDSQFIKEFEEDLIVIKKFFFNHLSVRITSVVYSIWENTVDEHTQTHPINFIRSSGNLAALSNPAVEGGAFGGTLSCQPANDL